MTPALAHGGPRSDDRQLDQAVNDTRSFIDTSKDRDGADKHSLRHAFDDSMKRPWWHWGSDHSFWHSCEVIQKLTKFLGHIDSLRQRKDSAFLEELYTKVWTLRSDLLQNLPEGTVCKGFEDFNAEPVVKVGDSTNQHVVLDVGFSTPSLSTVKAVGQTFTRVSQTGIENQAGAPGEPAIPKWRTLVALPQGATPVIKGVKADKGSTLRLNLVPYQPQAVDQMTPGDGKPDPKTFADKPFAINQQTYNTNRTLPPNPCKVTPMGQYRDVQMAQLECSTAQYNPVTDQYTLNRGVNVEVAFEGGDGNFVTSRTSSPFESTANNVLGTVVNKDILGRYVKQIDISILPCQGEELLILTNSKFNDAAQRLAVHKRDHGMGTNVFNVGSDVPSRDTTAEIKKFIENRYDTCRVRPSYVLLMGDAEYIPTFYPSGLPDNAGSDFPYSNYVQILFDAFFPDFGVGRLPVDTLDQANTVVDKIVKYESDPPHFGLGDGAPYYTTAGLASQFQCCQMNANGTPANGMPGTDQRAFIETAEFMRNSMTGHGYTVPRIYTETVDGGGYCIAKNSSGVCTQTQAAYSGNTTPRRYFNGTLLPSAIGAGSGFAWNGNTTDISTAWNAGRFLFIHRDHGWPGGWANPGFSTSNVNALSNGDDLPVVWSVNCASGLFDNETAGGTYDTTTSGVYFSEAAVRKADGGAIAVIGDSRNSPTWANNALARGFTDAVWSDAVPSFGNSSAHKRLGDTLNWGKIYLATQMGVDQTAGSISVDDMGYEYHIWQLIGDPSMSMWTKNPRKLNLSQFIKVESTRLGEVLHYATEGATITKLQVLRDGTTHAIGRATVHDGVANMDYFTQPEDGLRFIYSASLDDAVSVGVTPDDQSNNPTGNAPATIMLNPAD